MKKIFQILALSLLSTAAIAKNSVTTVSQVSQSITLTDDVDYVITDATPFTTTGSVNIQNTDHAVVIIKSIKPSKEYKAAYGIFRAELRWRVVQ